MKRLLILIFLTSWVLSAPAATEYREFTSADGKTIRGAMKAYDAQTETVTIERDNRKTAKVPLSIFSEADQAYILEWNSASAFMQDRLLKGSFAKQDGARRKEEETGTVTSTGGYSREEVLVTSYFEEFYFELSLHNRNKIHLKDLRAEYVIFYEQSETSWEKPVAEQLNYQGQLEVAVLMSGDKTVLATNPVEIYKDLLNEMNWVGGRVRTGGKGDIHGARMRLYMKMPSGKEVMREFYYPDNLSNEKYPWIEQSSGD